MTPPIAPSRAPPIGTLVLIILAGFLYAGMMVCFADVRNNDAFGRGLAAAFGAIIGTVLWLAMSGLLIIAAIKGAMSRGAAVACFILMPASCTAMWIAGDAYAAGDSSAIWVAALLPPLIVLYALRARLPSLRQRISEGVANIVLGGVIVLLTATPLVKSALPVPRDSEAEARAMVEEKARQDKEEQRQQESRTREEARFASLTPDSSLRDYLDFLMGGDSHYLKALAGARLVKSRQADAVALLQEGKIDRLADLWQYDIDPASMCVAYGGALAGMASNIAPGLPNSLGVALDIERQLPNIKWLVAGRCDFASIFEPLEKNLRIVADSSRITKLADTLTELRQTK
jgi:hypothetical protein